MGIFSRYFRLNEDDSEFSKELATIEVSPTAVIQSITKRHRTVLENAAHDIQSKINQNARELIRLEEEYLKRSNAIKSDNEEFNLSLRALNASLQVYKEAGVKEEDEIIEMLDSSPKNLEN